MMKSHPKMTTRRRRTRRETTKTRKTTAGTSENGEEEAGAGRNRAGALVGNDAVRELLSPLGAVFSVEATPGAAVDVERAHAPRGGRSGA